MKNKKRKRGRCFRFAFGFLKKFPQRAVYCSSPLSAVFKPINLIISDQTRKNTGARLKGVEKPLKKAEEKKKSERALLQAGLEAENPSSNPPLLLDLVHSILRLEA